MVTPRQIRSRFLALFVVLGSVGLIAIAYVLVQQRFPLPFQNTYTITAEFARGDGLVSGVGQPVNVVGVKVGQVTTAELQDGRALVTMRIDRDQVPQVYADARATLTPITPLKDMQLSLDPGTASSGELPSGTAISVARTSPPTDLADLMTALDGDTRVFLASLISGFGEGTRGRGTDLRKVLRTLGPTVEQTAQISRSLAAKRRDLARLVTSLAAVTRAASADDQLASVIQAGDATLRAIAAEDAPLRSAIAQLPSTLRLTRATLDHLSPFAAQLGPTLTALEPAVRRLPSTLDDLTPFAKTGTTVLRDDVRPLVRAAKPLLAELRPSVSGLTRATPNLSVVFQALEYLVNEVAYNPPGDDEGFLLWTAWFLHNLNSLASSADAHGAIGRTTVLVTCYGLQGRGQLQVVLDVVGICPK